MAQAPDAGTLLRQQERLEQRREPPPQPQREVAPQPVAPSEPRPLVSETIHVSRFRVSDDAGMLFPEDRLAELVREFAGRNLTLDELRQAAARVTSHYQSRGYFLARAIIPQQEIADGTVTIHVLTGRLEGGKDGEHILIRPKNLRLNESAVRSSVMDRLSDGTPLRQADLERGMLLLNDLPGITAKANLAPGSAPGTVRVEVDASEGPSVSGSVGADSYGYRHTGTYRANALLRLNDPFAVGDAVTLSAVTSGKGLNQARLSYQRPIGYSGFRAGLSASHLQYKLGKELTSLNAKGDADTVSAFASYQLVRSRQANVGASLDAEYKWIGNEAAGTTTSDKRVAAATFNLNADLWDNLLGGGVTSVGLSGTYGRLRLNAWAPDLLIDRLTARTQGGYAKFNYSLVRQQRLGRSLSLNLSASGQLASKNLDSSEKISLGGISGVRAYPFGEATGDQGYTASAELRWETPLPLPQSFLRITSFVDTSTVWQHKNPWSGWRGGNANARNDYSLHGAGLGVTAAMRNRFSLSAIYARKIGHNPSPTTSGADSDGTKKSGRFWLQANVSF